MERSRTGKRQINGYQVLQSNIEMACYLGKMKVTYRNGLDKREVENYNKTKFVFDLEYGRVIDFKGTKNFFADLSSKRDKFTVYVRISRGVDGEIETLFCLFKTSDHNYPIVGVLDYFFGVRYQTHPKECMDRALLTECF